MKDLVQALSQGELTKAKELLDQKFMSLVDETLEKVKSHILTELYEEDDEEEQLDEANVQKIGRTKLIRTRIRGGKVQRRKKISAVKGYTLRGGKLVRMSAQEKMHRKQAARRSKFKRKAKMFTAIRKRSRSMRKRKAMGL